MSLREHQASKRNRNPECIGKKTNSEVSGVQVSSQHAELSSSPQPHLLFNVADIFVMPSGWS